MSLPVYLAMTAAEMGQSQEFSHKIGWMACHFSAYSTGLSIIPTSLPEGSLLIVNDRMPVFQHDEDLICRQLQEAVENLQCSCVLLDFQRPDIPLSAKIAQDIVSSLSCPVAVTEYYAGDLSCPVFLSPVLHQPLARSLSCWEGREIWLELALSRQQITITNSGCHLGPVTAAASAEGVFFSKSLCCRYTTKVSEQAVQFTLFRNMDCLHALLEQAEALGITRAVGLHQELGAFL